MNSAKKNTHTHTTHEEITQQTLVRHTHTRWADNLKCIHKTTNWHCTVIGDDRGQKLDFWPFSIEMKNGRSTIHIARKLHCKTLFSFVTHKYTHHPKTHLLFEMVITPNVSIKPIKDGAWNLLSFESTFFSFIFVYRGTVRLLWVWIFFFGQFTCSQI